MPRQSLTTLELRLAAEIDDDDPEDLSLIELAGDILEENFVEDFKNVGGFELPALVLPFGAILDRALIVEPEEGLTIRGPFLCLVKFKEDLLVLLDEKLAQLSSEEHEDVSSVLLEAGEQEEDLEDNLGLGTMFLEPPKAGIFKIVVPLPATVKIN